MKLSPIHLLLITTASLALGMAAPAAAQKTPDLPQPALPDPAESERLDNKRVEARLQREEKALRDLRQIVLKAQAQGNPVSVKDDGPDPQIEALRQRISDLEETLRRQTGQMEDIARNAQQAAKAAADTSAANQALQARLDRIEQPLLAAGAAALAAQQQQAQAAAAPPVQAAPAPTAGPGGGVLGTLRERGAGAPRDIQDNPQDTRGKDATADDEASVYRAARKTLDSGDYVGGVSALQDFLERYPGSPRAPEANYWLGRTLALRNMPADAMGAYARALKGWPQSSWAGDAVVRLASTLSDQKLNAKACQALAEFDSRYKAKAAAALRTRAKDIGRQASCS